MQQEATHACVGCRLLLGAPASAGREGTLEGVLSWELLGFTSFLAFLQPRPNRHQTPICVHAL
jgi:hypothetical protein